MKDFPKKISLTITNRCNLHCQMCGQWSKSGYMHERKDDLQQEMTISDWKRIIDELKEHRISSLLLRGGEVFLFPDIIELLEYINSKGIFISIDTNGTLLSKYADDIVRIGNIHLTVSVDGPPEIHDRVRGKKGCFNKIQKGIALLNKLESKNREVISKSITFTISRYSLEGLGVMPEIARTLSIPSIVIVPFYYFPEQTGLKYEKELSDFFNCSGYSWRGFQHEESGIDFKEFEDQYSEYKKNLKDIYNFPYMPFSLYDYFVWFKDSTTPAGQLHCNNVEKLIDIQPQGDANFCVDFPDYSFGNVKEATISDIWNSKKADAFRLYRRKKPLAVCYRCGAKYMSEIKG